MKKIVKRRKLFRINNPVAFGILCAMLLVLVAGVTYAIAAGVVAPAVRQAQYAKNTPTPSPTVPAIVTAATPTPDTEASPSPDPAASPAPSATPEGMLGGYVIGIDPARGYSSKIKGVSTGIYANRLNYAVSQLVKARLEAEGATVLMGLSDVKTDRENNERAAVMNDGDARLVVRLECNSVSSGDTRGAMVWVPASHGKASDCEKLASEVLKAYIEATDLPVRLYDGSSIRKISDNTFLNTVSAPVCTLIMGHISNGSEDRQVNDADFQAKMADGIVKGILAYLDAN